MTEPLHLSRPEQFDEFRSVCGLCESENIYKLLQDFRGSQIYRCRNCDIQFQNPQYSREYLDEYYSDYIEQRPEFEPLYEIADRYKLKYLEHFTGTTGKLLDLGCGNGHLLRSALKAGWEVTGYDIDPEMPQRLERELNVNVLHGDLDQLTEYVSRREKFDVVVMNQVLEHVKNPHVYFRLLEEILKPEGHLLLTVPNINSLSARAKRFLEKSGFRKKKVGNYYDSDHHLWYYTPASLTYLLNSYGFKIKCIRGDVGARRLRTPWKRMKSALLSIFRMFPWESTFLVVSQKAASK